MLRFSIDINRTFLLIWSFWHIEKLVILLERSITRSANTIVLYFYFQTYDNNKNYIFHENADTFFHARTFILLTQHLDQINNFEKRSTFALVPKRGVHAKVIQNILNIILDLPRNSACMFGYSKSEEMNTFFSVFNSIISFINESNVILS